MLVAQKLMKIGKLKVFQFARYISSRWPRKINVFWSLGTLKEKNVILALKQVKIVRISKNTSGLNVYLKIVE